MDYELRNKTIKETTKKVLESKIKNNDVTWVKCMGNCCSRLITYEMAFLPHSETTTST